MIQGWGFAGWVWKRSKENDSVAITWVNNGWWSLSEMWKEEATGRGWQIGRRKKDQGAGDFNWVERMVKWLLRELWEPEG